MPGELGNECEQQGVGYYEHRYSPQGDNTPDDKYERPHSSQILRVIKKMREQEPDNAGLK